MGLFNSAILDVIIGMIFVYLLLSIMCTAANEWVAALTRRRGKTLEKGIAQLLSGQSVVFGNPAAAPNAPNSPNTANASNAGATEQSLLDAFYAHPLIKSMRHDKNHPTYLSPRNFSATLTDIITGEQQGRLEFDQLLAAVNDLPDGEVRRSLLALLRRSDGEVNKARTAIEGWFNDAMDRVSGWYKRRTQVWTLVIALALTLAANADTIQIARKLWADPVLRSKVVEEAKARAQKPRPTVSVEYRDEDDPTNPTVTRLDEGNQLSTNERDLLGQLLGWQSKDNFNRLTPLGWFLTVLAVSLGAPFWFDMLNKIMNVRFAGKSPDERAKVPEKSDSTVRA